MTKSSLYKKLVRQFDFTIKNYQNVNTELDFTKLKKIILIQKKDNRYYRAIQQFLVYLRECNDKNEPIFIFHKSRKKYQRLLEKVESLLIVNPLEKKNRLSVVAATVKKSILKPVVEVIQALFHMVFFLQLFTKQTVTARPLEASRQTRSSNCVIQDPHCYHYDDSFEITKYLDDLKKSPGFSKILNRKQPIEFRFKDTIFILSESCLSRQSLAKNPQTLCRSDYNWFLESMFTHLIREKVRAEAQKQELNLKEADVAQIIRDICRIDPTQQSARQLMGIYSKGAILEISEFKLEKFIFNAKYLLDIFQSIFPGGNSDNLVSRVNDVVKSKVAELRNLESKDSNAFTSLNRDYSSRPLPETQSAISSVLQTDINTISSTSHRSTEGFNWMIIVPVAVGGIGIIFFIVVIIIWYSKKNRSENSGLGTERIPLLNSIPDNLHVLKIAGRLNKRLEFLKKMDRYNEEIGVHFSSFCLEENKEKAIEDLKKIQEALIKFLELKKTSNRNKDKILSKKLESALLIVESLMQRYHLLSLPGTTNTNENDYLAGYLKGTLRGLIDLMLINIEHIRDSVEKQKNDKLLDALLNLEKAIYDTMLLAHAEGYFEKYPGEKIKFCLDPQRKTNAEDNQGCELKKIKNLQGDVLSTLKFTNDATKKLIENLLLSKKIDAYNLANFIMTRLDSTKSLLADCFTDYNARWETLNQQTQPPIGSSNSPFFGQSPQSTPINQRGEEYTMPSRFCS